MKVGKIDFLGLIREEIEKIESLGSKLEIVSEQDGEGASKEEGIGEFYKYLPKFEMSEKAGEFGSDAQKTFQELMQNVRGKTLQEKIISINNFVTGADLQSYTVAEILSYLTFLRLLTKVLEEFGPSPAGFVFEAFLAALLLGRQVTGGSLPIDDIRIGVNPRTGKGGQPLSLKLIDPSTKVGGSLKNLIYFLGNDPDAHTQGIEYIVVAKWGDKELGFFSFPITGENFWDWIDTGYFKTNLKTLRESALEEAIGQVSGEDLEKELGDSVKQLKVLVKQIIPMFGFSSVERKFDKTIEAEEFTGSKSIPMARHVSPKKKEEMLKIAKSPAGMKAFEKFVEFGGDSQLEISDEDDLASAYIKIGERRRTLIDLMRKSSTKSPISIQHLRNYNDFLHKASGKAKKGAKWKATLSKLYTDDPTKWAETLERLRRGKEATQFEIDPREIRNRGTHMGDVLIGADKIKKAMKLYTEQLKKEVIPIYKNMFLLTENINDFYIGGDVLGGTRAAENANELARDASKLANQTK